LSHDALNSINARANEIKKNMQSAKDLQNNHAEMKVKTLLKLYQQRKTICLVVFFMFCNRYVFCVGVMIPRSFIEIEINPF